METNKVTTVNVKQISETVRFDISKDGKIISRLYIRDKNDTKPVYLSRLKTNKSYRRQGLATELLQQVIEKYKYRGVILRASSQADGPSITTLMRMYKKFGFKRKNKTQTMYLNPPRKLKKGDRTKTKCPNCGSFMTITPMSYTYYYRHGYDDLTTCCDSKYDNKALQCKKCKLSYAGNHIIKFRGFETNYWNKEYTLTQWIEEVNQGKGKDRIKYG